MKKILFLVPILLAGAAGGAFLWHYNSMEQALRRACVEVLEDRLQSPSSLKIVKWHELTSRPATIEEAIGPEPTGSDYAHDLYMSQRKMLSHGAGKMNDILFEYDADNAFGASMRGASVCSYHTFGGDRRATINASKVMIDGKTRLDLALDQLKSLK
ncbi:hypothetical protein ACTTAK_06690 [Rhodobacter capsulatus]|uniref:hypothetical protein n=1 Tax=Rhodobacter capsulatus TaxID=1061 RepID=UPI0011430280|nr:hypothetical protein [Rhodobacter capsulatus]TQD37436.1 hypothetical protein FKW81_02320 [Rhodobacter capsulatus]